jgi:hypothetical protein
MSRRDRRDRDIEYVQPVSHPKPQAKLACGCGCPTCSGAGHCHNMGSGCNVR